MVTEARSAVLGNARFLADIDLDNDVIVFLQVDPERWHFTKCMLPLLLLHKFALWAVVCQCCDVAWPSSINERIIRKKLMK